MTVHDLIAQIYARGSFGLTGDMRRITRPQLDLLRKLIAEDPEAAALTRASANSQLWTPSGRDKYLITEDLKGERHTITRLMNLRASGAGMLF